MTQCSQDEWAFSICSVSLVHYNFFHEWHRMNEEQGITLLQQGAVCVLIKLENFVFGPLGWKKDVRSTTLRRVLPHHWDIPVPDLIHPLLQHFQIVP